ncbi:MAG: HD-GYP domain-containing protein [Burkholderiaceae bacterium]|nr:HD-GYP domain-containing protein [Burkholderiaceae bacterium]
MSPVALKKISVQQVRLGMHLHELCGAWLDHPFWKVKFVLQDVADLTKLQNSSVRECWIDITKGLDTASAADESVVFAPKVCAVAAAVDVDTAADLARAAQGRVPEQVPFNEELNRAATLCNQARAAVISLFSEARMGRVAISEECEELVTGIAESVMRNPAAMVSLARLKTHDDYTYMHSVAVAAMMAALARQLQLDTDQTRLAAKAGLLHDMGKAVMPADILNKPGKLTEEEFAVIRTHPERGHVLLLTGDAVEELVLDVCLHHHEKIDGSGYPHRLPGDQISLFAKMGAVCDVYDAITSNRPYKQGWDPAESVARMAGWKGHFEPAIFKAFVTSLGIYPTGSLVRLKSGLLAVVTHQNDGALTSPEVKVFFSTKQGLHVTPRLLDLSDAKCADRIIGRESNDTWKFSHLDELWAGEEALRKIGRKR